MGLKTQKIAPQIEDKSVRTFMQFIRDDLGKLSDSVAQSVQLSTQTIQVTSGREFTLGKAQGAFPISQPCAVLEYITRKDDVGNFYVTMQISADNVSFIFLVVK